MLLLYRLNVDVYVDGHDDCYDHCDHCDDWDEDETNYHDDDNYDCHTIKDALLKCKSMVQFILTAKLEGWCEF